MKIGLIYDFRNPRKWRRPYPELYREILDQIVRAEELGYDNVWLAEHHFVIGAQLPGLDPKKAIRSLELFATEVMPSLR